MNTRILALLIVPILVISCTRAPTPTPTSTPAERPTLAGPPSQPIPVAVLESPAAPNPTTPNTPSGPTPTSSTTRYTVNQGDTLLGIALRFKLSMAAIQLANGLGESDVIRAGQVLVIPGGRQWEGEIPFWVVHEVQRGETLLGIAQAYDLTTNDILRVNAIADPALIVPGQPVIIPLDALRTEAQPTPRPRPSATFTPVPSRVVAMAPTSPISMPAGAKTPVALAASPAARPATPTAVKATLVPATVPAQVSGWAATVVALINQKRAAHGLPPLAASPELTRAAQAHANECAAKGWCSHTGADGADTRTREKRAGYDGSAWGENWVQALDPVKAVEWWYNETPPNDPHRQNLLNTRYADVGIGVASGGYGYYFIADFGRR